MQASVSVVIARSNIEQQTSAASQGIGSLGAQALVPFAEDAGKNGLRKIVADFRGWPAQWTRASRSRFAGRIPSVRPSVRRRATNWARPIGRSTGFGPAFGGRAASRGDPHFARAQVTTVTVSRPNLGGIRGSDRPNTILSQQRECRWAWWSWQNHVRLAVWGGFGGTPKPTGETPVPPQAGRDQPAPRVANLNPLSRNPNPNLHPIRNFLTVLKDLIKLNTRTSHSGNNIKVGESGPFVRPLF